MSKPILGTLSAYAKEIGIHHATLAKRLKDAGITPWNDTKQYSLKDVMVALNYANKSDTEQMTPVERRVWFDSELKRLRLEVEEGKLTSVDDARFQIGEVVTTVINNLSVFGDLVERDLGANSEVVEKVEGLVNELRATLAQELEK